MPGSFIMQPHDLLVWAALGLLGGLVGGMIVRGGSLHWTDALTGVPGALLGGVAAEFLGLRESTESVASYVAAVFVALVLALVVRLLPGRFSA
jgi:uncharacterized membrane protein YeaQ/YmgE (transglycosylase-associated protein family)